MSALFSYIFWNVHPEILPSLGWQDSPIPARWYGLFFAFAFLFGHMILSRVFRKEGVKQEELDTLTIYMIVGTVLGARLGHCLFYEPDVYLLQPWRILKVWEGGLASHGAAAGILLALWRFAKTRTDKRLSFLWTVDRIVIVVALGGAFIRLGNLMNSEIVGKPSEPAPYTFVFAHPLQQRLDELYGTYGERPQIVDLNQDTVVAGRTYQALEVHLHFTDPTVSLADMLTLLKLGIYQKLGNDPYVLEHSVFFDEPSTKAFLQKQPDNSFKATFRMYGIPRHPGQLYEAISTFLCFVVLLALWNRWKEKTPEGLLFGLFTVWVFGLRIVWETVKENQVDFENRLPLNMGQILSIPLVLAGIWLIYNALQKAKAQQAARQNPPV